MKPVSILGPSSPPSVARTRSRDSQGRQQPLLLHPYRSKSPGRLPSPPDLRRQEATERYVRQVLQQEGDATSFFRESLRLRSVLARGGRKMGGRGSCRADPWTGGPLLLREGPQSRDRRGGASQVGSAGASPSPLPGWGAPDPPRGHPSSHWRGGSAACVGRRPGPLARAAPASAADRPQPGAWEREQGVGSGGRRRQGGQSAAEDRITA